MTLLVRCVLWWLCCGAGACGAAVADDSQVLYPAKSAPANAPAGAELGSYLLWVGLAAVAIGGWLVWRHRRLSPRGVDGRSLAISETRSLGNRQYLVVASYEGKRFLLGVCPDRITLLSPLPDDRPVP